MAKRVKSTEFVPRRIDAVAVEEKEGWVRVEGIAELVRLEAYTQRQEEETREYEEANHLGIELKVLVRDYLRTRLPLIAFQDGCRKLSYALPTKIKVKGAPFASAKSYHDEYHQTHFIRACIAVANAKEPSFETGASPEKLCFTAKSEDEMKRERARMYRTVYDVIPKNVLNTNVNEELKAKRGSIQYLEDKILAKLEEVVLRIEALERNGDAKRKK